MARQRELSFDEDKPIDYVAQAVAAVNAGDYVKVREVYDSVPIRQRMEVRRTVAIKTGVFII